MVQGVAQLRRQLARAGVLAQQHLRSALEQSANEIVAEMNMARPIPEITVAWKWGAAPRGTMSMGSASAGGLRLTIYAIARTTDFPQGHVGVARWFEFGTGPRVQKTTGRYTGFIPAQPFFWPIFRANRSRVRRRLSAALRKALAEASR